MSNTNRTLRNIADFIIVFECSTLAISRLCNAPMLSGKVVEAAFLIATACVWVKNSLVKQISSEHEQRQRETRIADLQIAAMKDIELLRERKVHSRMSRAVNH